MHQLEWVRDVANRLNKQHDYDSTSAHKEANDESNLKLFHWGYSPRQAVEVIAE
jgi:hypothetical protein